MPNRTTSAALAALLDWHRDLGADDAIGEAPVDWLARGDAPPGHAFRLPGVSAETLGRPAARTAAAPPQPAARPAPQRGAAVVPRQLPTQTGDAAVMAARSAARAAGSLEELRATLAAFDGCALKATAKNLCFYRGAAQARLMLIGEAPGRDEDLQGKPFVGRAGQLLDRMLAAIGLSEADVHITNIVYWRPPGNRTPTPQEAQVCRPFLERQVELVAPEIIVPLGGAAAKHLLDVADGIMKLRGKLKPITVGRHGAKAMATLHPAFLLRTPAAKRQAWRDLLAIRALLDGAAQA
jgi:DNA polymerase